MVPCIVSRDDFNAYQLSTRINYKLVRLNSQRIIGPPLNYFGTKPERGSELFVCGFPPYVTENDLLPVFMSVAPVYTLRYITNCLGISRGFCFVEYFNAYDAHKAMRVLNRYHTTPGLYFHVKKSINNCRLFIGNISVDMTRDRMYRDVSQLCSGLIKVQLRWSRNENLSTHFRFAFLTFDSNRHASIARGVLRNSRLENWGCISRIEFADPNPRDLSFKKRMRILIIRNVPLFIEVRRMEEICLDLLESNDQLVLIRKIKHLVIIECATDDVALFLLEHLEGHNERGYIMHVYLCNSHEYAKVRNEYKS